MSDQSIKLTQYSHGAGCGCKISPKLLDQILQSNLTMPDDDRLIVGNHSKDDAAVFDLRNGTAIIATTDFFMPIVDDPFEFGRIASANAISDVYAMGGSPIMAIAILGWPVNLLSPEIAKEVIAGSRYTCREAGIPLAGGHSIDSPEPIFGLAVNGLVDIGNIKQNNQAKDGDLLFLTKGLGVGILTTAEKKGLLKAGHKGLAAAQMMRLNRVGETLGGCRFVSAMTDVTGFGLLGHLVEMTEGSRVSAVVDFEKLPLITDELRHYIEKGSVPGGTTRNWDSYGDKITFNTGGELSYERGILADPQTSGGLLVAVNPDGLSSFREILESAGLTAFKEPIGRITSTNGRLVSVNV